MNKEKQYCCNENEKNSSSKYINNATNNYAVASSEKSAKCNSWTSVSQNYDIKESCEKNEKSATDNQWCSCSK
ncbi:hypothetical protein [Clostridium uliginosum]|uniref:Uncharacterized protein n=1 Tax=Clostridium uliginosum TaxID=119641 RepID=A0A1I1HAZ1_9CLOT|nr:hypothetical protein [Clostridium uliginosum]SFC21167.1 hypothetical protein SAMN05421842_101246 [Clostridium uliginosum]